MVEGEAAIGNDGNNSALAGDHNLRRGGSTVHTFVFYEETVKQSLYLIVDSGESKYRQASKCVERVRRRNIVVKRRYSANELDSEREFISCSG
jgi:hypothetical protein